jgi:hypothetical protein
VNSKPILNAKKAEHLLAQEGRLAALQELQESANSKKGKSNLTQADKLDTIIAQNEVIIAQNALLLKALKIQ